MSHQQVEGRMRLPILFRQRMPFLPLLGLGVAGILLAEWLPLPSGVWLGLLGITCTSFLIFRDRESIRQASFATLAIAAFAAAHLWQDRDALPAHFAQWLGDTTPLVEMTGTVSSKPRIFSERSASFDLKVDRVKWEGHELPLSITTLVRWPGTPPNYGDKLSITGVLQKLPPPRNPGQFDFTAWAARQGKFTQLEVDHPFDAKLIAPGEGSPLMAAALAMRESMARRLTAGIDDPVVSDLILGMVLGDTSTMPEAIQKEFRGTGTFHLFSVSGLHVGILSVILWWVLRTFRVQRGWASLIIIPALFFYALMTGFQAASVRSAIMASIMLAGFFFNRQPHLLNNLCAAGFLILLFDTNQLFNAGFQLSFTVVAVILLISEPLTKSLGRPFQPDPFFPRKLLNGTQRFILNRTLAFAALVAVSLAAWLGSLPLTLNYFNLVSLSALPANLLAVPLSFAIMIVAALSLGTGLVSPWVGEIYNQTNWLLTKLLLAVIHFFASLPSSYVYLGPPADQRPLAEIVVFDAGAGGAIWMQSKGSAWLIDCGNARFQDSTLLPFLRERGRMGLDGLVITHGDAAHIAGAVPLLDDCPPRMIIDSALNDRSTHRDRLQKTLAQRNLPKSIYRTGDEIRISPVAVMEVLYPPSGITGTLADDKALVLRLTIGQTRILLMSDSGSRTENWLLQNARDQLSSDILVKGTPRSGPSGEPAFLDAVKPRVIIASSTKFPTGELVSEPWAETLPGKGIRLLRQDKTGAITIKIYPQSLETTEFLSNTKAVFAQ